MVCEHLKLPNADKLDLHRWRTTLADRWDNLAAEVGQAETRLGDLKAQFMGASDSLCMPCEHLRAP